MMKVWGLLFFTLLATFTTNVRANEDVEVADEEEAAAKKATPPTEEEDEEYEEDQDAHEVYMHFCDFN